MKTIIFCVIVFLTSIAYAVQLRHSTVDPRELATALNIPPDADLVQETQKHWLRQPGKDRWEVEELPPQKRELVLSWAEAQGMFLPWKPVYQKYDKAIILGTSTTNMKRRLDYLRALWNEGVRFKTIVWLTGDRPLDPRIDDLAKRCDKEAEAAFIIWQEASLPDELRALPVSFLSTPMHQDAGIARRPNTADTLYTYLEMNPKPCSLLFISDQPFCGYQLAVIANILPDSFSYDLVGPGAINSSSHPRAAAILLDNIARWLYEQANSDNAFYENVPKSP